MIAVLLGILLAEFSLKLAAFAVPAVASLLSEASGQTIPDPLLGYRGNPKWYDHDERGYRNEHALTKADIVVLGDSHAYGAGVSANQAWPYSLGRDTGFATYNMAFGGYGTAHSLLQLEEAIELAPRLVILAVYFGNDFADNFWVAMRNERIKSFLSREAPSELARLDRLESLEARVARVSVMRKSRGKKSPSALKSFLSDYSALYSLGRVLQNHLSSAWRGRDPMLADDFDKAVRNLTDRDLQYCSVFEDRGWRTILTGPYRGLVNDRDDMRIQAGYDLTSRILLEIRERLDTNKIRLLVVLLPTKESVFASRVSNIEAHVGLAKLVTDERENREGLIRFMELQDIHYLDTLPFLQRSASQPYFHSANGHPNALGHEIIAREVGYAARGVLASPSSQR